MTYIEKRRLLVKSPAYRKIVRRLSVLFVLFAIVMDGLMMRLFLTSGGLFPGDRRFFAFSLFYWSAAAALLFGVSIAILRFVVPAMMSDAKLQKVVQR